MNLLFLKYWPRWLLSPRILIFTLRAVEYITNFFFKVQWYVVFIYEGFVYIKSILMKKIPKHHILGFFTIRGTSTLLTCSSKPLGRAEHWAQKKEFDIFRSLLRIESFQRTALNKIHYNKVNLEFNMSFFRLIFVKYYNWASSNETEKSRPSPPPRKAHLGSLLNPHTKFQLPSSIWSGNMWGTGSKNKTTLPINYIS